jgi:hypothetical protein
VILKPIAPPSMDDFDDLIEEARRQARQVGLTEPDIDQAIAERPIPDIQTQNFLEMN